MLAPRCSLFAYYLQFALSVCVLMSVEAAGGCEMLTQMQPNDCMQLLLICGAFLIVFIVLDLNAQKVHQMRLYMYLSLQTARTATVCWSVGLLPLKVL